MLSSPLLVFDEGFEKTTGAQTLYTADHWHRALAAPYRLSLHVQMDQRGASSVAITVQIEHSADRRNWTNKNTSAELTGSAPANTIATIMGGEAGTRPSLSHVRLRVDLSSFPAEGRIRIWVTGRGKPD